MGATEWGQKAKKLTVSGVTCFVCCCPRSILGLVDMMRSETTREFALAVIIGETFMTFIEAICTDLIVPCCYALVRPQDWDLGCVAGCEGIVLVPGPLEWDDALNTTTYPNYLSPEAAALQGALVLQLRPLLKAFISFALTLLTTYWFFAWLDHSAQVQKSMAGAIDSTTKVLSSAKWKDELPQPNDGKEGDMAGEPRTMLGEGESILVTGPGRAPGSVRREPGSMRSSIQADDGRRSWTEIVEQAASEQEAMEALRTSHRQLFYLHGDRIRRMVRYRLDAQA